MKIIGLLILISNTVAFILALVYHQINNKLVKEYERRLNLINKVCDETLAIMYSNYDHELNEEGVNYILSDIINIIERGHHL